MSETWKTIPNFPNYEVSDLGNIRRKDGKKFTMGKTHDGYPRVSLKKGSAWLSRTVHPLVLEAFVGPRPKGYDACHNDGSKDNNKLSNLRWDTRSNNTKDSIKHGTYPYGQLHGKHKLTNSQVKEIRKRAKSGETGYKLSKEFKIDRAQIYRIIAGQERKNG